MAKLETQCSVCKKMKFANPAAYAARIKKFGSLEEIAKKWVCRDCANGNKPAKEIKSVKVKDEAISPKKVKAAVDKHVAEVAKAPYTKEKQLGKKEKKTLLPKTPAEKEAEDEDFLAH